MKSTKAMRDRIRELMPKAWDDYDRAVDCVLEDLETSLVRIEALEAEVEKWHRVAMKAGAITCTGGGHIYPLRGRIEALEAALRQVIDSVHDYERANNLAPTPPRTECWDSVAHAIKVLAGSQDK